MDLLARDAADRFIGPFIGRHFFSGPALHVLARVRAAIKECRHRNTTNRFKFARIELYQKKALTRKRRTFVPKKMAPTFGASFRFVCCLTLVAAALFARNHTAIVPLDGRGHHAAVLPRADPHAAWAYADGGV